MYYPQKTVAKWKSFLLLFVVFAMCFCFRGTSHAAVSVSNIKTASEGNFEKVKNNWVYRYEDGTIAKNCLLSINGKTYLFSSKGIRLYGKQKIGSSYYYFGNKQKGYMYKNCWATDSKGNRFFLKSNGKMAFKWLTWKGNLYYLQKDGTPATGWQTINGYTYYFSKKGAAYTGRHTINGKTYTFSNKGKQIHTGPLMSLTSDCAILMNANTGEVLYEKYADLSHANASTTKIMTCILALENCRLNETVTVSDYAASQEPTKLYMTPGDSFCMKDLLYSLMLPSHNDSAVAIAEHISGTEKKFCSLMNKKAKTLGCTHTHFATPNGLDNKDGIYFNHYTTARDLAIIARYAWKKSAFRKIVGTYSYHFSSKGGQNYQIVTTNELLNKMTGVKGIKTGYTNKAGYCFVGVIHGSNGTDYISVTLGAPTSTARWNDTAKLLQYAYNLKQV